jgi:hypothetical protein
MISNPNQRGRAATVGIAAAIALGCPAFARPALVQEVRGVFSVDYRGSTISNPDSATMTPITEADVLRSATGQPAFGPLPPPGTVINGGNLGLSAYTMCVGHPPGTPCGVEVDALSFGRDTMFDHTIPPGGPGRARLYFSVDRFAVGDPSAGVAPSVFTEGALGANEAAADVFTPYATLVGPIGPGTPGPNVGVFDGNGLPSTSGKRYRGFGLREPGFGLPPFDNLDALVLGAVPTGTGATVYFSLDAAFVDPLTGQPNTGSAQMQGVPPSAVLKRMMAGGPITIYAQPAQLGLSTTADDIER